MEWDKKSEMIRISNHDSSDSKEFREFVMNHVDEFDNQAWDMYLTAINLIPTDILANIAFHKHVCDKMLAINPEVDYKTELRKEIYKNIVYGQ